MRQPANAVVLTAVVGIGLVTVVAIVASAAAAATVVVVPLLGAVFAAFALLSLRLRRRYFALYAEYGGRTVQVFGASDERRYNQVCRAVVRAREYEEEHH